jgi:dTDP-4-amino-4,6-dideoxygalactose transaminase
VLYDIDPHSLSPDWDSVLRCLMAGATHLVVAHLFGRVVDVSIASELAKRYGAVLVEDAAQGAGGSRNGIPAGKLADISVLSFGRGKGLNAGGGGALSVTSGDWESFWAEVPQNIPGPGHTAALASLARVAVVQGLSQPWIYAWPSRIPMLAVGQTVYREPHPVRAPDVATRVLITEALELSSTLLPARQEVEAWYYRELVDWPEILVAAPADGDRSGALRFPVRIAPEMATALRRFGVARSYPRTLRDYPEVAPHLTAVLNSCTGAEELARNLHTLPTHGLMQEHDRRELVHALVSALTRR